MSTTSSVASSVASFRSSASAQASTGSHGSGSERSDGEVRYSEASFEADDSPDTQHATAVEASDGVDDYEDEAFEEPEDRDQHASQDSHDADNDRGEEVEYSDDFSESNEQQNDDGDAGASTSQAMARDQGKQQPNDDLPLLVEAWARETAQRVRNRHQSGKTHPGRTATHSHSSPLTKDAISTISARLKLRKNKIQNNQCRSVMTRAKSQRMPTSVMDRVRVQHLVALSAMPPVPVASSRGQRPHKDSISTFCAVKTADLGGQLATMRLQDLCAKWHVPTSDDHTLSQGVLEFIASTARDHNRHGVIRASDGDECVFRALQTHAVNLERTVEEAKKAVTDSKTLLMEAQRILLAPDARPYRCNFRSIN